jgi:putative ribosome biogenesis GTPase RsgA
LDIEHEELMHIFANSKIMCSVPFSDCRHEMEPGCAINKLFMMERSARRDMIRIYD